MKCEKEKKGGLQGKLPKHRTDREQAESGAPSPGWLALTIAARCAVGVRGGVGVGAVLFPQMFLFVKHAQIFLKKWSSTEGFGMKDSSLWSMLPPSVFKCLGSFCPTYTQSVYVTLARCPDLRVL